MNLPEFRYLDETADKFVVTILNKARMKYGTRLSLFQLAGNNNAGQCAFINLSSLKPPLAITSETLIKEAIENIWRLTTVFAYHIKYLNRTKSDSAQYYYYENDREQHRSSSTDWGSKTTTQIRLPNITILTLQAIFSQPTATYPVPQATASVFFRVEEILVEPLDIKPAPKMTFRVEGHHESHDIRYVIPLPDYISEVIMWKIKTFRRIEKISMF